MQKIGHFFVAGVRGVGLGTFTAVSNGCVMTGVYGCALVVGMGCC